MVQVKKMKRIVKGIVSLIENFKESFSLDLSFTMVWVRLSENPNDVKR